MRNPLKTLYNGIVTENPTFVLVVGLCASIAVTSSAINGIRMGLATTAVLIGSNFAVSLLRKIIPNEIRIPAFIVIIAGFVTVLQLVISAYLPVLNKTLGIFIPLIVVNCIILARAESFAFRNDVFDSVFDGVGIGLGFTGAITLVGGIRELFGSGTLFGVHVMPAAYTPALFVILAPGGFMTLGVLIALFRLMQMKREEKKRGTASDYDGWKMLDGCNRCSMRGVCGGFEKFEKDADDEETDKGAGR